jgi:hypothetical protein
LLHDRAPEEAVIDGTKETDLAKRGALMVGMELPDDLKNVPLSILSSLDVQLHLFHSLFGASARFVT